MLDYNKHAHGRYTVCETADHLSFGSYVPKRWEIPLAEVASVFAEPPEKCMASPSLEVTHALQSHIQKTVTHLQP